MINKKNICWVTASYMLQVDLPLLADLNNEFEIDWYYWGSAKSSTAQMAQAYADKNNISLSYIEPKCWIFNPLGYMKQCKILNGLSKRDYDIYYFDISTFPWLLFAIKRVLPKDKVIIAMHHGKPHSGMRFKPLYIPFLEYLNKQDYILQYYSKTQSEGFKGMDDKKKYVIPLALNDFGESFDCLDSNKVTFTAFGNIIDSKNIDLLIEAGNILYERFPGRFRIKIVGHCKFWKEKYEPLIRYKEAFELDIRRIKETEIAPLFGSTHYLMLPYKSVTQSGPLRIAYGYNTPVIASDLEGFKESIEDGVSGFIFESENVESLLDVMSKVIKEHPDLYHQLKQSQKGYVAANCSTESICRKYSNMFNDVIKGFK